MLRLKPNYNLDKLKKIKSLIKEGSSICTHTQQHVCVSKRLKKNQEATYYGKHLKYASLNIITTATTSHISSKEWDANVLSSLIRGITWV